MEERPAVYEMDIKVTEASIDALSHVNNREYLRWMEIAAVAHSTVLGWSQERYLREGHVWVARQHWIEYLRPALLGDEIRVHTWVQSITGPVCLRRYSVTRAGKELARAATEWAHIGFSTKRAVPPSEELAAAFPIVPADSPLLREKGIWRCVKWMPASLGRAK